MWKRTGCTLGLLLGSLLPVLEEFKENEERTGDDDGVGDVEGVPVMGAEMEVDEVGDAVAHDAIEQISSGATENEGHAGLSGSATGTSSSEEPNQENDDATGEED